MKIAEDDLKRIFLILLISILGILTFFIVRPVLLSIIGGLILAYVFYPVHRFLLKRVKYETLAACIVSILVVLAIVVPLWFFLPTVSQSVFDLFRLSQNFDITTVIRDLFPGASDQFVNQLSLTLNNAIGQVSSTLLNSSVNLLVNFAIIALHMLLVGFVFFFALKDGPKLRTFVSEISPLRKSQEKVLVQQFEDITKSIVYGQIIIGLIQGILAGIGFLLFGIEGAFILTVLSVLLGIIPVIGPGFVFIPVTAYLFVTSDPLLAAGYLLYNLLTVSSIDNILRAHLVSRKTKISQVVILVGMIGGLFLFGVLGLLIGPLVLAYFVTFLKAYRDKTLSSLFD